MIAAISTIPASISDAKAPWGDIIEDVINRNREITFEALSPTEVHHPSSSCKGKAEVAARDIYTNSYPKNYDGRNLLSSIRHHEDLSNALAVHLIERQSMEELPRPVLAALSGCISGSLASPWCRDYATHRLENALDNKKKALVRELGKNRDQYEKVVCLALTGLRNGSSQK